MAQYFSIFIILIVVFSTGEAHSQENEFQPFFFGNKNSPWKKTPAIESAVEDEVNKCEEISFVVSPNYIGLLNKNRTTIKFIYASEIVTMSPYEMKTMLLADEKKEELVIIRSGDKEHKQKLEGGKVYYLEASGDRWVFNYKKSSVAKLHRLNDQ